MCILGGNVKAPGRIYVWICAGISGGVTAKITESNNVRISGCKNLAGFSG